MEKTAAQPALKPAISLSEARDLTVVIAIFLFFTGWIYLYFFYHYFGLSVGILSTSYSDYLVYSYFVLSAYWGLPILLIAGLIAVYLYWFRNRQVVLVALVIAAFPLLAFAAKKVATEKAFHLREDPQSMRHISFVFREHADMLAPGRTPDSALAGRAVLLHDNDVLRNNDIRNNMLFFLGQNEDYYFVLYQPKGLPNISALTLGTLYYVNKQDVLYSKITISSND